MFERTIEQFFNTEFSEFIKPVILNLEALKKESDLNERIRLKAIIQQARERLLAKLMTEDIRDAHRFRPGEDVICWHPSLYLGWGDVKASVIGIETDEQGVDLVKVTRGNGIISRFAPNYVQRYIPREILSFSYWP